jgi:hypothetical protein
MDFLVCGVEVWRGGLSGAYLLPTLSVVGASLSEEQFKVLPLFSLIATR